jgi:ankyrin repeat protein
MSQQNIALFLGPHIDSPFAHKNNVHTIRINDTMPSKHFDNVILYGHGNVEKRNTPSESHKIGLRPTKSAFDSSTSTIKDIIDIMQATTPKHIDLVSCFGGAVGEDIKAPKNFNKIVALMSQNSQKDLTISVFASSKHVTLSHVVDPYMRDILSIDTTKDPWLGRVHLLQNYPETLKQYRIHINDDGVASLIGFKIRAPKTINDIRNPAGFIGSHALYGDKAENKNTRTRAHIVTEIGQESPYHQGLLTQIQQELQTTDFTEQYTHNAALISAVREKPELLKEWIDILPNKQKLDAISHVLRQPLNFDNTSLIRSLIDSAPIDKKDEVIRNLVLYSNKGRVLEAITPHEKVTMLYNTITNPDISYTALNTVLHTIDFNTQDDLGNTIMHKIIESGSKNSSRILLQDENKYYYLPIDITLTNKAGQTIADLAITPDQRQIKDFIVNSERASEFFTKQIKDNNCLAVQKCLLLGCNIDNKDHYNTPIICALRSYGDPKMLKLLLSANPNIMATDLYKKTALQRIPYSSNNTLIPLLEETEASYTDAQSWQKQVTNIDVQLHQALLKHDINTLQRLLPTCPDAKNFYGDPLLNVATRLGDTKMVKVLLDQGANPTIAGRWGDTALKIAQEYGNPEVLDLIKQTTLKTTAQGLAASKAANAILSGINEHIRTTTQDIKIPKKDDRSRDLTRS